MSQRCQEQPWLSLLALLVALGSTSAAAAQGSTEPAFRIKQATTSALDNVIRLDADINYSLPAEPLQALENGVPIVFELTIRVTRSRRWLPNETVASLLQQYRLKYHSLTATYLVTNLNSGVRRSFPTMRSALREMGKIRNLPIIDVSLLEPGQDYWVELRVGLDIEALPAPLRLLAYLSADWWTTSEWLKWQL